MSMPYPPSEEGPRRSDAGAGPGGPQQDYGQPESGVPADDALRRRDLGDSDGSGYDSERPGLGETGAEGFGQQGEPGHGQPDFAQQQGFGQPGDAGPRRDFGQQDFGSQFGGASDQTAGQPGQRPGGAGGYGAAPEASGQQDFGQDSFGQAGFGQDGFGQRSQPGPYGSAPAPYGSQQGGHGAGGFGPDGIAAQSSGYGPGPSEGGAGFGSGGPANTGSAPGPYGSGAPQSGSGPAAPAYGSAPSGDYGSAPRGGFGSAPGGVEQRGSAPFGSGPGAAGYGGGPGGQPGLGGQPGAGRPGAPKPHKQGPGVMGPLTVRDILLLVAALFAIVGMASPVFHYAFDSGYSSVPYVQDIWVWHWQPLPLIWLIMGMMSILAAGILTLLNKTVQTFPQRIGSLSPDQLISALAVVGALTNFLIFVTSVPHWHFGAYFAFVGSLLALFAALFTMIPFLGAEFADRDTVPAHAKARPVKRSFASNGARDGHGPAGFGAPGGPGGLVAAGAQPVDQQPAFGRPNTDANAQFADAQFTDGGLGGPAGGPGGPEAFEETSVRETVSGDGDAGQERPAGVFSVGDGGAHSGSTAEPRASQDDVPPADAESADSAPRHGRRAKDDGDASAADVTDAPSTDWAAGGTAAGAAIAGAATGSALRAGEVDRAAEGAETSDAGRASDQSEPSEGAASGIVGGREVVADTVRKQSDDAQPQPEFGAGETPRFGAGETQTTSGDQAYVGRHSAETPRYAQSEPTQAFMTGGAAFGAQDSAPQAEGERASAARDEQPGRSGAGRDGASGHEDALGARRRDDGPSRRDARAEVPAADAAHTGSESRERFQQRETDPRVTQSAAQGAQAKGDAPAHGKHAAVDSSDENEPTQWFKAFDYSESGFAPAAEQAGAAADQQGDRASAGQQGAGSAGPLGAETQPQQAQSQQGQPEQGQPAEGGRQAEGEQQAEENQYAQAFWFAVPEPRPAIDPQSGQEVFTIFPGEWYLALADHGTVFSVRSSEGVEGVLYNIEGIQRG